MSLRKNSALTFIFITLIIDVIGFGIIMPVVPRLITTLTNEDLPHASKYGSFAFCFSFALAQFLFSPVFGALSDRYGRRPVLLCSLFGFGVDYLITAFAPTLAWLFVGRIIAGITGASFTTAAAYISDVSTPEKRAQNFGLIGGAFGIGFVIGPALGGLVSHSFGVRAPFILAACFSLLNFLFGYFILPESLPLNSRRRINWKRANPVGSLLQLRKYPLVSGLVVSLFLLYMGGHAVHSNWGFYTMFRFHWTEDMVGVSLAAVGLLIGLVQGVLVRFVNPRIGSKNAIYIGMTLYTIGMLSFAFAFKGWMLFVFMVPYCLGGIAVPALQSIISAQVPPNEQGELQGALSSLISLTSIVGPLLMNNLFYYFSRNDAPIYFPEAPFVAGALVFGISTILAARTIRQRYQP